MIHIRRTSEAKQYKRTLNWSWKTCLEIFTLLYIGAEILCQEFLMCYITSHYQPLAQFLSTVKVGMLWAGFALTAANVLFGMGWRSSRRVFLLYGVCIIDALASFMATSDIKLAWIHKMMRETTTVVLFYCAAKSVRKDFIRRWLHRFYWVSLFFWSAMCCLSLCQFALMLGGDGALTTDILLLRGIGYYGRRLYGAFNILEYGAVTSLMIMLAGGYYFARARIGAERILLVLCNAPLLLYLVLSGSRNAQVALYLSLFLGAGMVFLKRASAFGNRDRNRLMAMVVALAVVACAHLGYIAIQRGAGHVPRLFSSYSGILSQNSAVQASSADEGNNALDEGKETETGLFDRIDVKEDISTNRFSIWKDYIGLWKEYGLFGLSSTYDGRYIQEHHPDLFICEYIREYYPESYAKGSVYHPHNGYLKTLVSTGYLGFALLMLFLLGSVRDVWMAICASKRIRPELLFPLLMVAAGCSSTMFDLELFFVFNPITYIFWLAFGILMEQAGKVKKPETAGNKEIMNK